MYIKVLYYRQWDNNYALSYLTYCLTGDVIFGALGREYLGLDLSKEYNLARNGITNDIHMV